MIMAIVSLVSGLLFSFGLIISGMTDPKKVIGFLDVFGDWDYSLVFVMGGAILFNVVFLFIFKKSKPVFSVGFSMPTKSDVDWRLISGAACFGIGWGLVGICPGPAIVNLTAMSSEMILFVLSMFGGMAIFKYSLGRN